MRIRLPLDKDPHTSEVIRGASAALAIRVAGAAVTFGMNVMIARLYGAAGSGMYFLALTVMTIATVFGRMGMDNSLLRFVAGSAALDHWESVQGVYRIGMRIAVIASVVTTAVMALSAVPLARVAFHKPEMVGALLWMSLGTLPVVAATLYGQVLRALKRIWASMLVLSVWTPLVAVIGMWFLRRQRDPVTGIQVYVGATVVTAVGAWWWWRRVTPQLREVRGTFDTKVLLQSSTPLLWVASMTMAMNWIANFALGAWGSVADVGVFNAASRVSYLVSFVLIAVDSISAPKFAALYAAGDHAALERTARNTVRLMLLLAAPALMVIAAVPRLIMGLFGPDFRSGWAVLVILGLAQGISVMAGSVGSLLMMTGHERQVRDSNTVAAVVCLVLCLALVPRYSALGAAVAVATSLAVRNLYEVWMVRRHLGIRALILNPRRASPGAVVP